MEQNNQNMNAEQGCGCRLCQKWGWCPAGKWGKIIKIIVKVFVLVIILCIVGRIIFGGHEGRGNNQIINTITVSGTGEVVVKPDIATVSFGVSAENLDVSKAQTNSATKMNSIIDLLKKDGVAEKDIKTTNYSIYPRYDYKYGACPLSSGIPCGGGTQVLAAYVVSQTVEVKIRDISKAGEILSGIGEFGVTDVSGLTFTVDNENTVKDQARDLAIKDARSQAEVLAKDLGVRLVKITSFSENGNYPIYYGMEKATAMGIGGAAVAPQVPAGQNTITSNVSITYEIR